MNQLLVGFGRTNINPMMGIKMRGNYSIRLAESILDDLELNALAVSDGTNKAILISMDNCAIMKECADEFRTHIGQVTGVPREAIYIHTVHTHTGPHLKKTTDDPLEREYFKFIYRRMADVATFALADLKPAKMGWATGMGPELAFIRRFIMKDGSMKTNPGVNNPEIAYPLGEADHRVNVLRFDREGGETLVLVNYGNHPDVIGGCKISADWPGFLRRAVERNLPGVKCIFFNGAQGDVNHINVHPTLTEADRMSESGKGGGYEHSKYMGKALAGTVLQLYDKTKYTEVSSVSFGVKQILVPANVPDPKDLPEAHRLYDLYLREGIQAMPGEGMMKTTILNEAERMVKLENSPEFMEMELISVAIGPVALIGMPGEPFVRIGRELKETPGWELVLPTCITNGYMSYFPMKDDFADGGFEARSSEFRPGVAESIIEGGQTLLETLAPQ